MQCNLQFFSIVNVPLTFQLHVFWPHPDREFPYMLLLYTHTRLLTPPLFVLCMTNRAVGYQLDWKESSLIPTLRSKTLPMFQLNASTFIRPDEGWGIQSKCRQGFPISKLISENYLFRLCRSELRSNHLDIGYMYIQKYYWYSEIYRML